MCGSCALTEPRSAKFTYHTGCTYIHTIQFQESRCMPMACLLSRLVLHKTANLRVLPLRVYSKFIHADIMHTVSQSPHLNNTITLLSSAPIQAVSIVVTPASGRVHSTTTSLMLAVDHNCKWSRRWGICSTDNMTCDIG